MATTDQLLKASRRTGPQLNDFRREGWIAVLRAMDIAKFGDFREIITWRQTKLDLFRRVCSRIANGEPMPPRAAIAKAEGGAA